MAGRPYIPNPDPEVERARALNRQGVALLRKTRRENGLCHDCGKPRTDRVYCDSCRQRRLTAYSDKYRDRRVRDHKIAHQALKRFVFEKYGGCLCACCGETHIEFLSLDHIKGDGPAHRKANGFPKAGGNMYSWAKTHNFPPGFRVLCMNCNFALGHCGYCPHQQAAPA